MRETVQPGVYHIEINERIVSEEASIWMRFDIPSQDHLSRVVATRYGRAERGICIKIASEPKFDPLSRGIGVQN
jgi:hypothetical protein